MLVLADTHVFNPSLVNVARFGYMRFSGISSVTNPILASDLGTQSPIGTSGAGIAATGITVDGLFTIGDAGTPFQTQTTNSFIWQDMASLTRGRQSIRTGAEVKRHEVSVNAHSPRPACLTFAPSTTSSLARALRKTAAPAASAM